jgi:hypothetical protein
MKLVYSQGVCKGTFHRNYLQHMDVFIVWTVHSVKHTKTCVKHIQITMLRCVLDLHQDIFNTLEHFNNFKTDTCFIRIYMQHTTI